MYLSRLRLFQFRNIAEADLRFTTGVNLICGRNGQGKTNIVEAIHLLSSTKSFRTAKLRELVQWGKTEASAHGVVIGPDDEALTLGVIQRSDAREFLVDDKTLSAVDFVGRLLCVTFNPADIDLVKGAPQGRRQFLDKHTVDLQPGILQYLLHYNRALKTKNQLLKTGSATPALLDPWDRVLADAAAALVKVRRRFIELLNTSFEDVYSQFASVDGAVGVRLKESYQGEAIATEIYRAFIESRAHDIAQRKVSVGPHRDDFEIFIGGKSARSYASQGQSKSLALALKIAALQLLEKERQQQAIFLLDDVDSELDESRLERLYQMILTDERQVIVTGTEPRVGFLGPNWHGNVLSVTSGLIQLARLE